MLDRLASAGEGARLTKRRATRRLTTTDTEL
jgi:hypothetical protein